MEHHDRPDRELVELARRGWPSAFAVLLYRHGADVRAVVEPAPDPLGAVHDTFLIAMRRLDRLPADQQVRDWLLDIAAGRVRDPRPAPDPGEAAALDDADLDELWAELAARWPDGRKPRRPVPTALRWAGIAVLLVAVAAVVPLVVFSALDEDDLDVEEVRAQPYDRPATDDEPEDDEPGDDDGDDAPIGPGGLDLDELDDDPVDTEAGADPDLAPDTGTDPDPDTGPGADAGTPDGTGTAPGAEVEDQP